MHAVIIYSFYIVHYSAVELTSKETFSTTVHSQQCHDHDKIFVTKQTDFEVENFQGWKNLNFIVSLYNAVHYVTDYILWALL